MKTISIIIPCYNEEDNIPIFYREIKKISEKLSKYKFEYIFSLDVSTDNSYNILRKLNKNDKSVKYIFMSNRSGKEACMFAGLEKSIGDYVAIMDVDLQDPPILLVDMVNYLESGEYDSVATRRINRRGEPLIRSLFSRLFYGLVKKVSNLDMRQGTRDFRLMNRKMVNAVLLSREKHRFIKAIYGCTGFRTKWIEFENKPREIGKTKWSFWKLFSYSLVCIFGYTSLPLAIVTLIGLVFLSLSIINLTTFLSAISFI